jgi:hypothetical protein
LLGLSLDVADKQVLGLEDMVRIGIRQLLGILPGSLLLMNIARQTPIPT